MTWQESLFDGLEDGGERLSFDALRRDALDTRSWLDVVPGWVPDHGELFERLLEIAPWQQRTRKMWDSEVLEPRLVAAWGTGEPLPMEVAELGRRHAARLAAHRAAGEVGLRRADEHHAAALSAIRVIVRAARPGEGRRFEQIHSRRGNPIEVRYRRVSPASR